MTEIDYTKKGVKMTNKNYMHGRSREYYLMNKLRAEGFIVMRTAGSHGIADIIAIDSSGKFIYFIQAKPRSMSIKQKLEIEKEQDFLNDNFKCRFNVISLYNELNFKEVNKNDRTTKNNKLA